MRHGADGATSPKRHELPARPDLGKHLGPRVDWLQALGVATNEAVHEGSEGRPRMRHARASPVRLSRRPSGLGSDGGVLQLLDLLVGQVLANDLTSVPLHC